MYARLKQFRESLGLTQAAFGKSIGMAKSTYNNYEVGVREPKSDFWIAIARKYNVTIDYLMGFSDDPHATSDNITSLQFSSTEVEHIKKYRALDIHGRKIVDMVLSEETARLQEQLSRQTEDDETVFYNITGYEDPMSAGTGQPAGYGYGRNLLLIKEPPPGTSYVAPIAGNSMEPTYHDGDKLFIQACYSIEVGEVGVFYMDGQQWVKELGNGVLISHNPAYAPRQMTDDIRCQGRVLGVCDESYLAQPKDY